MQRLAIPTAFLCGLIALHSFPSGAQSTSHPIIAHGTCDPKSGVAIDDGDQSVFACDAAIIARTERGTVLIQFADKTGDDGRLLGFGGRIEGKQGFGAENTQMMAVERIYLGSGNTPVTATRGTCILNWTGLHRTGGKLTSILCSGVGSAEGHLIKALAILEAEDR